jgi:hypothetical protein
MIILSYVMKRMLLPAIMLLLATFGIVKNGHAQCTTEICAAKLADGFTFLKGYQLQVATVHEVEYSYVFSKGTSYQLVICNQDGTSKDIEVTLYDSQRHKLISNFDKETNKYYGALIYDCQTTGIFYMKYTYKNKPTCCNAVLAFKRK